MKMFAFFHRWYPAFKALREREHGKILSILEWESRAIKFTVYTHALFIHV